ncbi:hypothetical protein Xish_00706 [Xenorhabdus ishibashii]|uniref:Uncharacterized protein n=1 Tax=Xenorhabdus ishibashii TaxID=1034471 RepID=A0A2D0KDT1_9GAMM|nr:hypothetical protein Xish_00706 [Xenorhabdus ishibashii]
MNYDLKTSTDPKLIKNQAAPKTMSNEIFRLAFFI